MYKSLFISIPLFFFAACDSNIDSNLQSPVETSSIVVEKELSSPTKDGNITRDAMRGATLSSKCTACHGTNFEKSALGKSVILKGQTADGIEKSLKAYKAGTLNKSGMGALMRGQVGYMTDEELKAMAVYISTK